MLLLVVRGAQSYEALRTYNNITHPTLKEAYNARGLLSNDQKWYNAFDESAHWATSNRIRQLFVTMLLFCEVGDEYKFFKKIWKLLTDDIQYSMCQTLNHLGYQMLDVDLRDQLLQTLGVMFNKRGRNIKEFNFPRESVPSSQDFVNQLLDEEHNYDAAILMSEADSLVEQLNH
jgi:hypothetical protein